MTSGGSRRMVAEASESEEEVSVAAGAMRCDVSAG